MAYYDALVAKWATLASSLTTNQKLANVNGLTQTSSVSLRAILSPSSIINAIVPSDLAALTQLQVSQMSMLLSGSVVDASQGTTVRAGIQNIFAGKTTTLQQLGALVAPYDSPTITWCQANGYPYDGLQGSLSGNDLSAAGGLT